MGAVEAQGERSCTGRTSLRLPALLCHPTAVVHPHFLFLCSPCSPLFPPCRLRSSGFPNALSLSPSTMHMYLPCPWPSFPPSPGCPQQHAHVSVMPTCMHDPLHRAVWRREALRLGHRQGVHVRSQGNAGHSAFA